MIDLKDLKEKTSLIYKKYNDFLAQQSLLSDTVAEIANLNSQRRKLERKKDQYNRKLSKINSSNINPIKKQQKLDSLNQEYDLSAIQKDIETIRNSLNTAIAQKKELEESLQPIDKSKKELIENFTRLSTEYTSLIAEEQNRLSENFDKYNNALSEINQLSQELDEAHGQIQELQTSKETLFLLRQKVLHPNLYPDFDNVDNKWITTDAIDKRIEEVDNSLSVFDNKRKAISTLQSDIADINPESIDNEWEQLEALKKALKSPRISKSPKKNSNSQFDIGAILNDILTTINIINPNIRTISEEMHTARAMLKEEKESKRSALKAEISKAMHQNKERQIAKKAEEEAEQTEIKSDANITANQEPEEIIESEEIIEPEDENTKDNTPDNDLDDLSNSDDLDEHDDSDDSHELDDLDDLDDPDTLKELDKDPSARFFQNDEFEFENNEDENKLDEPVEPVEPVVEPVEPVEPIEQPVIHKESSPIQPKSKQHKSSIEHTTKAKNAFKDILEYSKHVTYSSPQATRVESPIADDKTHIVSDPHIVEGEYENTEPPIVKEKHDNSEDTIDEMNPPPATKRSFLKRAFTALVLPLLGVLTLFGVINNRNHSTTNTLPASNAQEREIDNNDENLTYSDSSAEHITPSQIEADSEQIISETTVNDSSVPTASEDKDLSSSPISPTPTPIPPTLNPSPTPTPTPPPHGSPEFYLQASQEYGDLANQYHEEAENFKREAEDYKTQAEQARGEGNYDLAKSYDKDAEKAENNYKDSKKLEKRATNAANFYKEKAEKEAKKETKKAAQKAEEEARKAKEETKKSEEEAKKQQDKFKDEIKVPPQQSPIPAEYDIGTQITLPKGMPHWENSEKTIGPGVFKNDVDVQICAFAALDENGNYIPETRHMSRDAIEASYPGKKIMALVGGRGSDGKFDNDYENPKNWKCWVDYDSIKSLIMENSIKDFASSNLGLNITFDNYEAR